MKTHLKVIIVLLLIIMSAITAYYIADKESRTNDQVAQQTTVTKKDVTEKDTNERIELFSAKKQDYFIYKQGKKVILVHGGKEYVFENWSQYIDLEKPTVYATDVDRNGDLEILIRMVGIVDENGEYHHFVYALNETYDDEGNMYYFVNTFTQSAIVSLIDDKVTAEVSQIDDCVKTGVFAMCMNYTTINYDKETNLPDKYYNLFRTLQDEKGQYLKIAKWTKGLGDFVVRKKSVEVSCPIYITYENGQTQNAGVIKCGFDLNEDNTTNVLGGTFVFEPNEEYKVFSYDLTTNAARANTIINKNKSVPADTIIDSFEYDVSLDFEGEKTADFSKNGGDLNCISQINSTESYVEFVAKEGCRFNEQLVAENKFFVKMNATDVLINCTYDVGYVSTVTTNENGLEVLRLTFDKKYKPEVTKQTQIKFGEYGVQR